MRLFIPDIGDELKLTTTWKFRLHYEARNEPLGKALGIVPPATKIRDWVYPEGTWSRYGLACNDFAEVTLPKGTVLKVHRVYIRQGGGDYSSLTFSAQVPGSKKRSRFWVKLADVNNIRYERSLCSDECTENKEQR